MNKNMVLAIGVVAIVVAAGAAYFVIGGDDDDSRSNRVGEHIEKSDFPSSDSRLWVYGNANEDDKIDESDVAAIEKMIAGEEEPTLLADTNCDDVVDDEDVDYLRDIISATSDTKIDVYYIDYYFNNAKISWPVNNIATSYCSGYYTFEVCGLMDKIVLVDDTIQEYWSKLNSHTDGIDSYGSTEEPNYEKMMSPKYALDVYVPGYCDTNADAQSPSKLNPVGIDVMFMNTSDNSDIDIPNEFIDRSIIMTAFLLQGDMEHAYKYLAWHDKIIKAVKEKAATLSDSEKMPLIMSRSSPSYSTNGSWSITGKDNTNLIHAEWAGVYAVGQKSSMLAKNYQSLTEEQILEVLREVQGEGYSVLYWIDNEHDGLRGQRDLDDTVKAWADKINEGISGNANLSIDVKYLGMAREAGNSPLYVLEMVFYMNIMYPGLLGEEYNYETLFNEFIEEFTDEPDLYTAADFDIGNFFKSYPEY